MQVINELYPGDPASLLAWAREPGPAGPLCMVNLLRFREQAAYPDGRDAALSGRAAYARYAAAVSRLLPEFGGYALLALDVSSLILGQVESLWDEIAIAVYPDRGAMLRMSMSSQWQAIAVHRSAGLAGQLNIETTLSSMDESQLPMMQQILELAAREAGHAD